MILGDIEEHLKGKSKVEYIFIWAPASVRFWNLIRLKYVINQTAFFDSTEIWREDLLFITTYIVGRVA
jgi:hypothetical protein